MSQKRKKWFPETTAASHMTSPCPKLTVLSMHKTRETRGQLLPYLQHHLFSDKGSSHQTAAPCPVLPRNSPDATQLKRCVPSNVLGSSLKGRLRMQAKGCLLMTRRVTISRRRCWEKEENEVSGLKTSTSLARLMSLNCGSCLLSLKTLHLVFTVFQEKNNQRKWQVLGKHAILPFTVASDRDLSLPAHAPSVREEQ